MGPLSSGKRCACPTKKERGEPAYLFGFTVCLAALLSFFCLAALLAFACFCAACLFLVFGDLSPISEDCRRTAGNREQRSEIGYRAVRFFDAKRASRPTR